MLAILAVLTLAKGDCDTPLKAWLQTMMMFFGIHFTLLVAAECLPYLFNTFFHNLVTYLYAAASVLLSVFMVGWFALGNYWYYSASPDCETRTFHPDFSEGYAAVRWILMVYYAILGLAACSGCLLGVFLCVGGGLTTRSNSY